MIPIDLTNRRFGRWLVLKKDPKRRNLQTLWTCLCDCGIIRHEVLYTSLTSGRSKSCGCLRREKLSKPDSPRLKHPREYFIWQSLKTRCCNPAHPTFQTHGAKGITLSPHWENSFDTFLHDMGPAPHRRSRLRRINPAGNFTPDNCIWT